jgi:predicted amidohydrolase YtcJ
MAAVKADLVFHEGAVFGHPGQDSVAVAGGRVVACGRFGDLKSLVGPGTHLVRLGGRTVAPGFIDCHLPFMEAASVATGLSLQRCRTIGELLADLRVASGRTPPGNWMRAFGCDEALVQERRGPTRAELDQSAPKNPLRLRHQTLHASWLNSRAINLLGLEHPDFRPPAGAIMQRDAGGQLTGLVAGMEVWLSSHLPRVTPSELESRVRGFSRELAAAGVTAFTDATVSNGPEEVATFGQLRAGGSICQHMSVMVGGGTPLLAVGPAADAAGMGLAGFKFMDVTRWKPAWLAHTVAEAMAQGMDCAFHSTEIEELEAILHAIEAARERVPEKALQSVFCRIEHGGLIPPDYPERIAALNAWVVTNPGFVYYRGAKYAGEPGLIPYLYRARSLADAGVRLAAGSDAPVTPARPLPAIAAAIARMSVEGYELAPQEKITALEAFALFTSAASILARIPAGDVAPGYLADLIVLPADPLTLKPAELANLCVDLTIVSGRIVYERGRPLAAQNPGANPFSA